MCFIYNGANEVVDIVFLAWGGWHREENVMAVAKKLTPQEFRTMQLLELDLLIEFDRVCRKHGIKYCITCGTLLGAVRHKDCVNSFSQN